MKRIVLVNPNTNVATTTLMLAFAREYLAAGLTLQGATAACGSRLIVNPDQLRTAAAAVVGMAPSLAKEADGVIVSAFGDPGVDALQQELSIPVVGIAESAMREAAAHRRPFAVVTTTPALVSVITALAERLEFGHLLAAVRITAGSPEDLMAQGERLVEELERATRLAVDEYGAETIIVGGGPLAAAARVLRSRLPVQMVEPIPAAMRRVTALLLR